MVFFKRYLSMARYHMLYTVFLFCVLQSAQAVAGGETERVAEARQLVKTFGGELIQELKTALAEGGPVEAINVCNVEAPAIASRIGNAHDWKVGRTSLKPRNGENAPDSWEKAVLTEFENRLDNGAAIADLEYFEEIRTDGGTRFRYMKAIPTRGLCLACHGQQIAPEIRAEIDRLYPDDRATGFSVGDIRGAFTLSTSHQGY